MMSKNALSFYLFLVKVNLVYTRVTFVEAVENTVMREPLKSLLYSIFRMILQISYDSGLSLWFICVIDAYQFR